MANRLQHETSPYLLQHANNPVDWYPWGDEALKAAVDQEKPIFLSVGYAACHWCHVMEHESFEDPEIAALMNEFFINIKVDREERPDVDSIYMDAVVSLTGQGGWPMSIFLTPDAKPFYGGTYFPPNRRYNLPSFREVLTSIHGLWVKDRNRIVSIGDELSERITQPSISPSADQPLDLARQEEAKQMVFQTYDWTNGGWGSAPKFPQASTIEFMLQQHHRTGDKLALDIATHALDHMWMGGIYDHIGGGFHRYAVDASWLVPHFEKMLYDNAQLMRVYLHAWQISGVKRYAEVVGDIYEFLIREMRHEEGGFFASLDADTEGIEGKYYVWDAQEIESVLKDTDAFGIVKTYYGVTSQGNFEGKNVLHLPTLPQDFIKEQAHEADHIGDIIQRSRRKLLAIRDTRVRPATDDKVITEWNGLLLIALAECARSLGRADMLQSAQDLGDFLLSHAIQDGELKRTWRDGQVRYDAFLADHAALGEGLLALYQADFDERWYLAAIQEAEVILSNYWDDEGAFYDTGSHQEKLITRPKTLQDTPKPSGNSLAVSLLLKLSSYSGESRFFDPAMQALEKMQSVSVKHPTAFSGWLSAIQFALGPQLQLAIMGSAENENFGSLLDIANQRYIPNMVIASSSRSTDQPPLLSGREIQAGVSTAYLCEGFTCRLPTTSPEKLDALLTEAISRSG